MGDEKSVTALSAFWTGLLYDAVSLEAAYEMIAPWTQAQRLSMRRDVPRLGLMTPMERSNLYDYAAQAVGIAEAGLIRRNRLNAAGQDETIHLAPLEETIRLAQTPAERWRAKLNGEWGGDITRIFTEAEM